MARRTTKTLTEVELEFMQILWSEGGSSPEDIRNSLLRKGRSLTGGSIRKMLLILLKKGHVKRVKQGKKFVYSAKIQKDKANRNMVAELLNHAFGGSSSYLVATLLDTHPVPAEEIKKIEQLIAKRKKGDRK